MYKEISLLISAFHCFISSCGIFSKNHLLEHKRNVNKFVKSQIISHNVSNHGLSD